jgi:hypothetical protein
MSFRQFGGLNYASKHNIVGANFQSISNLQVTQNVGQTNSYINFLSDISGNININISGNLDVSGNTNLAGTLTVAGTNVPSDYRIKDNIQQLDDTFIVDNLVPVTYTNKLTNNQDIGLIAHELQEHYPYLVTGIKDGQKLQTVNYNGLFGILINEIKSLKKELKNLKDDLSDYNIL